MGFKDVEFRKFKKELDIKEKHHDLFKEAEQQTDVVTSTGANLYKFGIKSKHRVKKEAKKEKKKQERGFVTKVMEWSL